MELKVGNGHTLRPVEYCRYALQAIEVSEERRKRRKRDTGPDVLGMDIKRDLLRRAIDEEPAPDEFEMWLLHQVMRAEVGGPVRAMAIEILADYQNAQDHKSFGQWLEDGAPTPRFGEQKKRKARH